MQIGRGIEMFELSTFLPVLCCCVGKEWMDMKEEAFLKCSLENFQHFFAEGWRIELDAEGKLPGEVMIKGRNLLHVRIHILTQ